MDTKYNNCDYLMNDKKYISSERQKILTMKDYTLTSSIEGKCLLYYILHRDAATRDNFLSAGV